MPTPITPHDQRWRLVFETELGWMDLVASQSGAEALRFGYQSLSELRATLSAAAWANVTVLGKPVQEKRDLAGTPAWLPKLIAALRDFAAGDEVDFTRFPIQLPPKTPFQQRVINACRAIPRGQTLTYGKLAAKARAPGAARAVGQVMARNCLPLLIDQQAQE